MSMLLKEKGHAVAHLITLLRSTPLIEVHGILSLFPLSGWGGSAWS